MSLIENALERHRGTGDDDPIVESLTSEEAVAVATRGLIDEARHELMCVSAPEHLPEPVLDTLRGLPGQATGVRVLFHVTTLAAHRRLQVMADREESLDIRVTDAALQELLVVDRRVALVSSRSGAASRQAILVRSPIILRALHVLFDQSWDSASPINTFARLSDRRLSGTTRQILALLRNGQKDDVAARALGMSVRTYRRHVADIMRDINATSRFQAGVRTAELRLLAEDLPPDAPH